MSRRPPTGGRQSTGARPPAYRMPTGAGIVPGSGRPGSRAGGAAVGALSSQIRVADRPVTQQGLGGMKTGSKGPMRQVYDKSYYMGLLRGKTQELSQEITRLSQEIDSHQKENAAYLTYEQRAETLASEIKELRGELADYNTLMDKVNTDTEQATVVADTAAIKMQNDMEARNIDAIFAERQQLEVRVQQLEDEIAKAKKASEQVIATMDPATLERYQTLKAENDSIENELSKKQTELDELVAKTDGLSQEVNTSELSQESWRLHQQLSHVTARRDEWRLKEKETPQEERERLLRQVKADNNEIATMQKSTAEIHERVRVLRERLNRVDGELEEGLEERSAKCAELHSTEQMITEFMDGFEKSKSDEEEKIRQLEVNIVTILSHISQSMTQSQQLPDPAQYEDLQADLAFKQEEREKSEATARTLDSENLKLQQDLVKVEELEDKVTLESQTLKDSIQTMRQEIEQFSDIPALQIQEDERRQQLAEEKRRLLVLKEEARARTEGLASEYEQAKTTLEANDTYIQLGNLERKWQHHEQNNHAMKESDIATRQAEGSYQEVADEVQSLLSSYNALLCNAIQGTLPAPLTS